MKRDKYGQMIFTEIDLCDLYLKDRTRIIPKSLVNKSIHFDADLELTNVPVITQYTEIDLSIEEFDIQNQSRWLMPEEYKNLDIAEWVLSRCETDVERDRVCTELLMFLERNLFTLLQYLVYLVDTMRANNVVWGVGRGSSVSSYVLYLIGVHKIDSIKYELDIAEFLR